MVWNIRVLTDRGQARKPEFADIPLDATPGTIGALKIELNKPGICDWGRSLGALGDVEVYLVPSKPTDEDPPEYTLKQCLRLRGGWKLFWNRVTFKERLREEGLEDVFKDLIDVFQEGLVSGARIVVVLPQVATGGPGVAQGTAVGGSSSSASASAAQAEPELLDSSFDKSSEGEAGGHRDKRRKVHGTVAAAVEAIRAGRVQKHADYLELPEGIRWPCATSNILYKRFFYDDLFDHVMGGLKTPYSAGSDDHGISFRWLLSGQPGIGKSVFGWYLIYRVLTEQPDRPIVYISHIRKGSYLIDGASGVKIGNLDPVIEELGLINPLIVSDSYVCRIYEAETVIISSPGRITRTDDKDILNLMQPPLYFPILTVSEIQNIARILYPLRTEDEVSVRIDKWGCIPRHVLVNVRADQDTAMVNRITRLTLEELKKSLQSAADVLVDDPRHSVLAEYPLGQIFPHLDLKTTQREYYQFGKCQLLSDYVGSLVLEKALKAAAWDTEFFVDATAQIAGVSQLNGNLLEVIGKLWLKSGGTTQRRLLPAKDYLVEDIDIPSLPIKYFERTDALTYLRDYRYLFIPSKSNQASFDVIVWDPEHNLRLFINFTKQKDHKLKVPGLYAAVKALGYDDATGWPNGDKKVDFAFGVRESMFENLTRQALEKEEGLGAFAKNIIQSAFLIPSDWKLQAVNAVPVPE